MLLTESINVCYILDTLIAYKIRCKVFSINESNAPIVIFITQFIILLQTK